MSYKPGYYKNLLKKLNGEDFIVQPNAMNQNNLIFIDNKDKLNGKQDSDSQVDHSTGPTSIS